jgi:hypothetical protein
VWVIVNAGRGGEERRNWEDQQRKDDNLYVNRELVNSLDLLTA